MTETRLFNLGLGDSLLEYGAGFLKKKKSCKEVLALRVV